MRKPDHRRRYLVLGVLGALALAAGTAPLWGSSLGRKIEWLEVRRVEVSGTRLIAPHEVFALSGITPGWHLLDELEGVAERVGRHPGISRVEVTRRAPNTLRIRIEEKRPVAFVEGPELRLATAAGEILPLDPAAVPLDLPIVRGAMADSAGIQGVQRILAETSRLAALDPDLLAEVSELRLVPEGGDVLALSHRLGTLLLPFGLTGDRLDQLRSVLADLDQRFPHSAGGGSFARHRIDLRFGDQIVVLPSSPRELS